MQRNTSDSHLTVRGLIPVRARVMPSEVISFLFFFQSLPTKFVIDRRSGRETMSSNINDKKCDDAELKILH